MVFNLLSLRIQFPTTKSNFSGIIVMLHRANIKKLNTMGWIYQKKFTKGGEKLSLYASSLQLALHVAPAFHPSISRGLWGFCRRGKSGKLCFCAWELDGVQPIKYLFQINDHIPLTEHHRYKLIVRNEVVKRELFTYQLPKRKLHK